jgi:phosphohistidine phosphatase SixA
MPIWQRRRVLVGGAAALGTWLQGHSAQAAGDAPSAGTLAEDIARHGLVLLIRHAQTVPGLGDPPGFRLGECSTQRNLSDAGREQARRLGAALAARGLQPEQVRSSAWCRCIDTAELAFGRHTLWPALNSFFDEPAAGAATAQALRDALSAVVPGSIEAWVTHQVNITALTGVSPGMGEVLMLRGGRAAAEVRQRWAP